MSIDAASEASASKVKATRQDWLDAARAALIERGVDHVKVLTLAERLGVSRSSFYWYFKDRPDLLDNLVAFWQGSNTADIVEQAAKPARHIVDGVINVFECWTDGARFDPRLDFAMREWARRDAVLHDRIRCEDDIRVEGIAAMFRRHGFDEDEAFVRARVLYFMQIGYYALEIEETLEQRLRYTAEYVFGFTGVQPEAADVERFRAFARAQPAARR